MSGTEWGTRCLRGDIDIRLIWKQCVGFVSEQINIWYLLQEHFEHLWDLYLNRLISGIYTRAEGMLPGCNTDNAKTLWADESVPINGNERENAISWTYALNMLHSRSIQTVGRQHFRTQGRGLYLKILIFFHLWMFFIGLILFRNM